MKFLTWLFSIIFIFLGTFVLMLTILRISIINPVSIKQIVKDSGLYSSTEKIIKNGFLSSDFEKSSSKEANAALEKTFAEYNFQPIFENLIDNFFQNIKSNEPVSPLVVDLTGFKSILDQNVSEELKSEIPTEIINIQDEWRVDSLEWSGFYNSFKIFYLYYPYLILALAVIFVLTLLFSFLSGYFKAIFIDFIIIGALTLLIAFATKSIISGLDNVSQKITGKDTTGLNLVINNILNTIGRRFEDVAILPSLIIFAIGILGVIIITIMLRPKNKIEKIPLN